MVRLECDLQGGFDDILFDLETAVRNSSILVNLEDASDFYFDSSRLAVRVYKPSGFNNKDYAAMNFTLFQAEDRLYLSVITSGDIREPEMFKDDILINAVCSAAKKYCVQEKLKDIEIECESDAKDNKVSGYTEKAKYFIESDDSVKEAEESKETGAVCINESDTAENEDNFEAEDSVKPVSGILLAAERHPEYEKELMKCTFKHCRDTRCKAFMWRETDNKISKFEWKKRNINLKDIFEMWREVRSNKEINYDYGMRLAGIILVVIGAFLAIYASDCLIGIMHINISNILFLLFNIILLLAANAAIILGVLFSIKTTQVFFECLEWRLKITKFRQWKENKYILNADGTGIKNINEMILHDRQAEFCLGRKIIKINYEKLECIFETENLFVIMVGDRDIFAFAKCDMSRDTERIVREILKPYYERGYKEAQKYTPNQLFNNM